MNRLNYFHQYQSIDGSHENQLTRAYLVLLKYSSNVFLSFFEYCRQKHEITGNEKELTILENLGSGWEVDTQKENPVIFTNYLLSVLITDSHIVMKDSEIAPSSRRARYDGIVTLGDSLTIVIENKPSSGNVWYEQLNPARENLAEHTLVYSKPSILEWKEIIKHLNQILIHEAVSGAEKLLIEDFLEFVDANFPYLNPYEKLQQCKGNITLIEKRVAKLMKDIVVDDNIVKYHRAWGNVIQTPQSCKQINEIGLIVHPDGKDWSLELCLYFGDTQIQAINFYKSRPHIERLTDSDWSIAANFHFSFMQSNLVYIKSEDYSRYINFWVKNHDKICQQRRNDIPNYIEWLSREGVIIVTEDIKEKMNEKFYKTLMQTLNVCPAFGVVCKLTSSDAENLDKSGHLEQFISKKIKQALSIIDFNSDSILKPTIPN